ncbi:prepilin peptidase, partial [Candidatus Woesearchaeota archaeon]|nr:prepilin peptidase [Candidatus Woesearchaeota archaeon]
RLIHSIAAWDWLYLVYGIMGLAVFVGLAYLLYYTGQWGGGDSKLLMGIGVLFATYPSSLLNWFNPILNWPFLLIFIFNLFVVGAVYALAISIIMAIRNWGKFAKTYHEFFVSMRRLRIFVVALAFLILIGTFFVPEAELKVILAALAFFIYFSTHFMIFAKSVEKSCMYRTMSTSELTEGEWIAKDVLVKGKRICGPKDLGVSKKQIALLKRLKIKSVPVKIGIPFLPSFLIAMIISLIWGNVIFYLF